LSSLKRAISFVQCKARVIALTTVPLASLVGITAPARAGNVGPPTTLVLDPSGTDTCSVVSNTGTVSNGASCTIAQLALAGNGVAGIQEYGNATVTSTSDSIVSVDFKIANGTTNGGLPVTAIPASWLFTITDSNPSAILVWSLVFSGNGTPEIESGTPPGSPTAATSGVAVSGTATSNIELVLPMTAYEMDLNVTDMRAIVGETLTVNIPNGSTIDINSSAAAGVPEPGTFALLGCALAALGSLAWRRKRATL
jgi:PEP-CTERM motif